MFVLVVLELLNKLPTASIPFHKSDADAPIVRDELEGREPQPREIFGEKRGDLWIVIEDPEIAPVEEEDAIEFTQDTFQHARPPTVYPMVQPDPSVVFFRVDVEIPLDV